MPALRAPAGHHYAVELPATGADLGGVEVEGDRALVRQIHVRVEVERGDVVSLPNEGLAASLGADVGGLEGS